MKKGKISKIAKISIITILSFTAIIGFTVFLIIHTYINKMNLVKDNLTQEIIDNNDTNEEVEETRIENVAAIEATTAVMDSSQEDIKDVENAIHENTKDSYKEINNDDVFNILLIGCDSREGDASGRSDAMIIVSINSRTKKIVLTSLLRDIYLKIPAHNNNRLNAAYAYGGAKLLIDTIEENFQVDIDKYVSIDFYSFIDVVDSIGGVTLEVKEEYIPIINNYISEINLHKGAKEDDDILTQPGNYILNGKQTLGYVRNRYIGTDFDRTARQRVVLQKIFDKIKDLNLIQIKKMSDKVLPQVTTNLSEKKIISLLISLSTYKNYKIVQWSIPMEDSYSFLTIKGMSVIGINFNKNIKELHNKVYDE